MSGVAARRREVERLHAVRAFERALPRLRRCREQFLNADQVAERTGVSLYRLRQLRAAGEGPRFIRHGGAILYDVAGIIAWTEEPLRRASTCAS